MKYFKDIILVKLFLRRKVLNKKKTIENYFYFQDESELYIKNSIKKYNNIEEIVEELENYGLLYEITEYNGWDEETTSKGYVLFYSKMLRYLNKNSESLNNDDNIYKLLTINQVCEFLNISRPSVYKLLNDRQLPFTEILGHKRIQLIELLNFIQEKKSK